MRGALIAAAAFAVAALGGCRTEGTRAGERVAADPRYPPAVLTGDGELQCDISARSNGRQILSIVNGGGLEFDAVVSPIIDGTVTTRGPEKGGLYRFSSHLARPAKGRLPGRGEVEIEELETRVSVEMKRYRQPRGRGTELSFHSSDMATRGIYVEFVGHGRAPDGERFTFRINLGAPTDGKGQVVPADDNEISNIASKVVTFRAPTNTVLVTTTVQRAR
jgi:hypothetical protein